MITDSSITTHTGHRATGRNSRMLRCDAIASALVFLLFYATFVFAQQCGDGHLSTVTAESAAHKTCHNVRHDATWPSNSSQADYNREQCDLGVNSWQSCSNCKKIQLNGNGDYHHDPTSLTERNKLYMLSIPLEINSNGVWEQPTETPLQQHCANKLAKLCDIHNLLVTDAIDAHHCCMSVHDYNLLHSNKCGAPAIHSKGLYHYKYANLSEPDYGVVTSDKERCKTEGTFSYTKPTYGKQSHGKQQTQMTSSGNMYYPYVSGAPPKNTYLLEFAVNQVLFPLQQPQTGEVLEYAEELQWSVSCDPLIQEFTFQDPDSSCLGDTDESMHDGKCTRMGGKRNPCHEFDFVACSKDDASCHVLSTEEYSRWGPSMKYDSTELGKGVILRSESKDKLSCQSHTIDNTYLAENGYITATKVHDLNNAGNVTLGPNFVGSSTVDDDKNQPFSGKFTYQSKLHRYCDSAGSCQQNSGQGFHDCKIVSGGHPECDEYIRFANYEKAHLTNNGKCNKHLRIALKEGVFGTVMLQVCGKTVTSQSRGTAENDNGYEFENCKFIHVNIEAVAKPLTSGMLETTGIVSSITEWNDKTHSGEITNLLNNMLKKFVPRNVTSTAVNILRPIDYGSDIAFSRSTRVNLELFDCTTNEHVTHQRAIESVYELPRYRVSNNHGNSYEYQLNNKSTRFYSYSKITGSLESADHISDVADYTSSAHMRSVYETENNDFWANNTGHTDSWNSAYSKPLCFQARLSAYEPSSCSVSVSNSRKFYVNVLPQKESKSRSAVSVSFNKDKQVYGADQSFKSMVNVTKDFSFDSKTVHYSHIILNETFGQNISVTLSGFAVFYDDSHHKYLSKDSRDVIVYANKCTRYMAQQHPNASLGFNEALEEATFIDQQNAYPYNSTQDCQDHARQNGLELFGNLMINVMPSCAVKMKLGVSVFAIDRGNPDPLEQFDTDSSTKTVSHESYVKRYDQHETKFRPTSTTEDQVMITNVFNANLIFNSEAFDMTKMKCIYRNTSSHALKLGNADRDKTCTTVGDCTEVAGLTASCELLTCSANTKVETVVFWDESPDYHPNNHQYQPSGDLSALYGPFYQLGHCNVQSQEWMGAFKWCDMSTADSGLCDLTSKGSGKSEERGNLTNIYGDSHHFYVLNASEITSIKSGVSKACINPQHGFNTIEPIHLRAQMTVTQFVNDAYNFTSHTYSKSNKSQGLALHTVHSRIDAVKVSQNSAVWRHGDISFVEENSFTGANAPWSVHGGLQHEIDCQGNVPANTHCLKQLEYTDATEYNDQYIGKLVINATVQKMCGNKAGMVMDAAGLYEVVIDGQVLQETFKQTSVSGACNLTDGGGGVSPISTDCQFIRHIQFSNTAGDTGDMINRDIFKETSTGYFVHRKMSPKLQLRLKERASNCLLFTFRVCNGQSDRKSLIYTEADELFNSTCTDIKIMPQQLTEQPVMSVDTLMPGVAGVSKASAIPGLYDYEHSNSSDYTKAKGFTHINHVSGQMFKMNITASSPSKDSSDYRFDALDASGEQLYVTIESMQTQKFCVLRCPLGDNGICSSQQRKFVKHLPHGTTAWYNTENLNSDKCTTAELLNGSCDGSDGFKTADKYGLYSNTGPSCTSDSNSGVTFSLKCENLSNCIEMADGLRFQYPYDQVVDDFFVITVSSKSTHNGHHDYKHAHLTIYVNTEPILGNDEHGLKVAPMISNRQARELHMDNVACDYNHDTLACPTGLVGAPLQPNIAISHFDWAKASKIDITESQLAGNSSYDTSTFGSVLTKSAYSSFGLAAGGGFRVASGPSVSYFQLPEHAVRSTQLQVRCEGHIDGIATATCKQLADGLQMACTHYSSEQCPDDTMCDSQLLSSNNFQSLTQPLQCPSSKLTWNGGHHAYAKANWIKGSEGLDTVTKYSFNNSRCEFDRQFVLKLQKAGTDVKLSQSVSMTQINVVVHDDDQAGVVSLGHSISSLQQDEHKIDKHMAWDQFKGGEEIKFFVERKLATTDRENLVEVAVVIDLTTTMHETDYKIQYRANNSAAWNTAPTGSSFEIVFPSSSSAQWPTDYVQKFYVQVTKLGKLDAVCGVHDANIKFQIADVQYTQEANDYAGTSVSCNVAAFVSNSSLKWSFQTGDSVGLVQTTRPYKLKGYFANPLDEQQKAREFQLNYDDFRNGVVSLPASEHSQCNSSNANGKACLPREVKMYFCLEPRVDQLDMGKPLGAMSQSFFVDVSSASSFVEMDGSHTIACPEEPTTSLYGSFTCKRYKQSVTEAGTAEECGADGCDDNTQVRLLFSFNAHARSHNEPQYWACPTADNQMVAATYEELPFVTFSKVKQSDSNFKVTYPQVCFENARLDASVESCMPFSDELCAVMQILDNDAWLNTHSQTDAEDIVYATIFDQVEWVAGNSAFELSVTDLYSYKGVEPHLVDVRIGGCADDETLFEDMPGVNNPFKSTSLGSCNFIRSDATSGPGSYGSYNDLFDELFNTTLYTKAQYDAFDNSQLFTGELPLYPLPAHYAENSKWYVEKANLTASSTQEDYPGFTATFVTSLDKLKECLSNKATGRKAVTVTHDEQTKTTQYNFKMSVMHITKKSPRANLLSAMCKEHDYKLVIDDQKQSFTSVSTLGGTDTNTASYVDSMKYADFQTCSEYETDCQDDIGPQNTCLSNGQAADTRALEYTVVIEYPIINGRYVGVSQTDFANDIVVDSQNCYGAAPVLVNGEMSKIYSENSNLVQDEDSFSSTITFKTSCLHLGSPQQRDVFVNCKNDADKSTDFSFKVALWSCSQKSMLSNPAEQGNQDCYKFASDMDVLIGMAFVQQPENTVHNMQTQLLTSFHSSIQCLDVAGIPLTGSDLTECQAFLKKSPATDGAYEYMVDDMFVLTASMPAGSAMESTLSTTIWETTLCDFKLPCYLQDYNKAASQGNDVTCTAANMQTHSPLTRHAINKNDCVNNRKCSVPTSVQSNKVPTDTCSQSLWSQFVLTEQKCMTNHPDKAADCDPESYELQALRTLYATGNDDNYYNMIPVVSATNIITDGSTSTQAEALYGNCAKNQDQTGIPKKDVETGTVGACTCKSMMHAINNDKQGKPSYQQYYICPWNHINSVPLPSTDTVVFSLGHVDRNKDMFVEFSTWHTDRDAHSPSPTPPSLNRRLLQLPESSFVEDGHDASRRALSTSVQPSLPFVDSVKETPLAPLASTVKKSAAFRILAAATNVNSNTENPTTLAPTTQTLTDTENAQTAWAQTNYPGCNWAKEYPNTAGFINENDYDTAFTKIKCSKFDDSVFSAGFKPGDGGQVVLTAWYEMRHLFDFDVWLFQWYYFNPVHPAVLGILFTVITKFRHYVNEKDTDCCMKVGMCIALFFSFLSSSFGSVIFLSFLLELLCHCLLQAKEYKETDGDADADAFAKYVNILHFDYCKIRYYKKRLKGDIKDVKQINRCAKVYYALQAIAVIFSPLLSPLTIWLFFVLFGASIVICFYLPLKAHCDGPENTGTSRSNFAHETQPLQSMSNEKRFTIDEF